MTGGLKFGAPEEIRTPDPLVRSQVLYPAELRALSENESIAYILTRFQTGIRNMTYLGLLSTFTQALNTSSTATWPISVVPSAGMTSSLVSRAQNHSRLGS